MIDNWAETAANILKAELKRRKITYEALHHQLAMLGIADSPDAIKAKIHRGTFQFAFFLQCAVAIDMKNLRFDDLLEKYNK
jgi:hypothetical protein